MKNIQYVSIQGRCAPSFWFKYHDAHHFRSLIESITLCRGLVISSMYRTDIFFCSKEDKTDLILKIWCLFKGFNYTQEIKSKFIRTANENEAFEFYFDTLFHLMHHANHFEKYKEELTEIQLQEQDNEILNELMQCDLHLSQRYKEQEVDYISLALTPGLKRVYLDNYLDLNRLLSEQMKNMNYN